MYFFELRECFYCPSETDSANLQNEHSNILKISLLPSYLIKKLFLQQESREGYDANKSDMNTEQPYAESQIIFTTELLYVADLKFSKS